MRQSRISNRRRKRRKNKEPYLRQSTVKGETDMVIEITEQNFEKEVIDSEIPVLLDFWASWCGPCRMLSPVVEEIGNEYMNVKVGKVNVDEQSELAQKFGIMSIPTLMVFKNGQNIDTKVGVRPKSEIIAMLGV